MSEVDITVQPCGCLALPDEIVSKLRAFPGAVLRLTVQTGGATATLQVLSSPEPFSGTGVRTACAVRPVQR